MATIKDVARLAGVSISTVSRVTNNASNVSPAIRRKVLRAVKALNYTPSIVARSLFLIRIFLLFCRGSLQLWWIRNIMHCFLPTLNRP